jgi:HK97 family phage major capsid protein
VPRLTADATASAGTEGSPATDANTQGDHVQLGAFCYDGKFTMSHELLVSSEFNFEALLVQFAQRSIANKVAAELVLGAGTTEPTGVFTSGKVTVGLATACPTTATMDELIAGVHALPKGYRRRASMVVSDSLFGAILAAEDDVGDYVLNTLEGGGPLIHEHAALHRAASQPGWRECCRGSRRHQ